MILTVLLIATLVTQEFEAASIKPGIRERGVDFVVSASGRLTATNVTVHQLVEKAYGLERYQVTGGPVWATQDYFDVLATSPSRPQKEVMKMLQQLLADRFQLKVHREMKEGTVYDLVVKKSKLVPTTHPDDRPRMTTFLDKDAEGQRIHYLQGINATTLQLAEDLTRYLRHPVTNKTGQAGHYDFKIEYIEDDLPEAIQRALGLKLEAKKGSVETLVIDRVEKPTAN